MKKFYPTPAAFRLTEFLFVKNYFKMQA